MAHHHKTPGAGSSPNDSTQPETAAAAAHQPQPQALIITGSGRLFTPDGIHSLGTCGSPERAIEFCRQIGWSYVLRPEHAAPDLAGAGEGVQP